jgi:hypothetical protein
MRSNSNSLISTLTGDEVLRIWRALKTTIIHQWAEKDDHSAKIFLAMAWNYPIFREISWTDWSADDLDIAVSVCCRLFSSHNSHNVSEFILNVITSSPSGSAKTQLVCAVNYLLSIAEITQEVSQNNEIDFWKTRDMLEGYKSQDNTGEVQKAIERLASYEWGKIDHLAVFDEQLKRAHANRRPVEKIITPEPLDLTDEQEEWLEALEKHLRFFEFTIEEQTQIQALFPHITTINFENGSIYGIPTSEDADKMKGYLREMYKKDPVNFLIRRVKAKSDNVTLRMIGEEAIGEE